MKLDPTLGAQILDWTGRTLRFMIDIKLPGEPDFLIWTLGWILILVTPGKYLFPKLIGRLRNLFF